MPILEHIITPVDNGVRVRVRDSLMTGNRWKETFFPNISSKQMTDALRLYAKGRYIQDAFYFLTPDQREFLMTGLTADEFNELFAEEEL